MSDFDRDFDAFGRRIVPLKATSTVSAGETKSTNPKDAVGVKKSGKSRSRYCTKKSKEEK